MSQVCRVVDSLETLQGHRDGMARLAARPGAASGIVQHPDWIAYEVASRSDGTRPHVILVCDAGGGVVGYAPLLAVGHVARIDLGGRRMPVYRGPVLRLLGDDVVADAADRERVGDAIAHHLAGDAGVRVIRIQEAGLPSRFADRLAAAGLRIVAAHLRDQVHWSIDPQPSSETWLGGMDRKKRADLTQRVGRAYRKLGGDAALHTFDRAEDMREYARLMNEVYARTWHHAALPVDWEAPARVALFERLAAAGQLVGHVVLREGKPLAYVHGYRLGGTYLVDDLGYDEDVAKVGIGSVAVFQAIRALLDRFPGERISFGYGDNQYKRLLATRAEACGSLYVVRSMPATLGFGAYRPLRWAYHRVYRLRAEWRVRRGK